jgi:hypothetical protein
MSISWRRLEARLSPRWHGVSSATVLASFPDSVSCEAAGAANRRPHANLGVAEGVARRKRIFLAHRNPHEGLKDELRSPVVTEALPSRVEASANGRRKLVDFLSTVSSTETQQLALRD